MNYFKVKEDAKEYLQKEQHKKLEESNYMDISYEQWIEEVSGSANWCTLYTTNVISRTDMQDIIVNPLSGKGVSISKHGSRADIIECSLDKNITFRKEYLSQTNIVYRAFNNGSSWQLKIGK